MKMNWEIFRLNLGVIIRLLESGEKGVVIKFRIVYNKI
jgi:hypothetical protein